MTYVYKCITCKNVKGFERSIKEIPIMTRKCKCGGKMIREWNKPEVIFKGSGFYSTDNKKGKKSENKC